LKNIIDIRGKRSELNVLRKIDVKKQKFGGIRALIGSVQTGFCEN
jgi:hypothetical protein